MKLYLICMSTLNLIGAITCLWRILVGGMLRSGWRDRLLQDEIFNIIVFSLVALWSICLLM